MISVGQSVVQLDGNRHHQPVSFGNKFSGGDSRYRLSPGNAGGMFQPCKVYPRNRGIIYHIRSLFAFPYTQTSPGLDPADIFQRTFHELFPVFGLPEIPESETTVFPPYRGTGVYPVVQDNIPVFNPVSEFFYPVGGLQYPVQGIQKKRCIVISFFISSDSSFY